MYIYSCRNDYPSKKRACVAIRSGVALKHLLMNKQDDVTTQKWAKGKINSSPLQLEIKGWVTKHTFSVSQLHINRYVLR